MRDAATDQHPSNRDSLLIFRRDPVAFLRQAAAAQGDIARFQLAGRDAVLLSRPTLVRSLLVTHAGAFIKGPGSSRAKALLGDGMLTAEPPRHSSSRRRMQPAFARSSVAAAIPGMTAVINREIDRWADGAIINVGAAMTRITLGVAAQCLFGVELAAGDATRVTAALSDALDAVYGRLRDSSQPIRGRAKRLAESKAALQFITSQLIGAAPGCPFAHGPVPTVLRDAKIRAEEASEDALTILLAAHESLSIGLTWTFALLARYPAVVSKLQVEIDAIATKTGDSHFLNIGELPYTRAVLAESLRLYPPAWLLTREATCDVRLSEDLTIDAGTIVLAAPCVSHIDEHRWECAAEFRPERWTSQKPPHTGLYFPFGLGPRNCIGEQFAWTEGVLAIASIASRFTLEIEPSQPPEWEPLVNLRPRNPIMGWVKRR